MTIEPKNPSQGLLSPNVLGQLSEFIISAFKGEELRRLVGSLPHGRSLPSFLPGELASLQETAEATIALIQRHGVASELFDAMGSARPARWREIDKIRRLAEHDLHGDPRATWLLFPGVPLRGGRYELVEEIGGGGYGDVWKALDSEDGRPVALKFLRWRGSRLNEDCRRRFFRGARTIAEVRHPCIAQIVEPRCEEGGHDYYSMEYVAGGTLRDAILAGQIAREDIIALLCRVGDGLELAHAKNLIHRDIHPRNILVTAEGAPKVIDFDLVRDVRFPETRTGAIGTWVYTAPEVFEAVDVDVRSDVFSLAVTAVFAFSGRDLPPARYNHADMQRYVTEELACDPRIRAVLAKACEWKKELRYPTIRTFCDALAEAERAVKEAAERAVRVAAERAAREAAERAAREAAERAAREVAERAAREVAEREAREVAEREAREAAAAQAARAANEAAFERAEAERVAKATAERETAERMARARAAERSAVETIEPPAVDTDPTGVPAVSGTISIVVPRSRRDSLSSYAAGLAIVIVITLVMRTLLPSIDDPPIEGPPAVGKVEKPKPGNIGTDPSINVVPKIVKTPEVTPEVGTTGDQGTTTSSDDTTGAASAIDTKEDVKKRDTRPEKRKIDKPTKPVATPAGGKDCVTDEQRGQRKRHQEKLAGTVMVKIVSVKECKNMWLIIDGEGVGITPWEGYLARWKTYRVQYIDSIGNSTTVPKDVHIENMDGYVIDNR
jgi:serine/threonine protein kinase